MSLKVYLYRMIFHPRKTLKILSRKCFNGLLSKLPTKVFIGLFKIPNSNDKIQKVQIVWDAAIVVCNSFVYKQQLWGNSLEKQIINYKYIKKRYPNYCCKMEMIKTNPICIRMEKLFPLNDKDKELALLFLSKIYKEAGGRLITNFSDIPNSCYLKNGLKVVQALWPYETRAAYLKASDIVQRGIYLDMIHGDLHSGNLMKNKTGDFLFIDFDSVRVDFKCMDIISYIIWEELLHENYTIHWWNALNYLIKNEQMTYRYNKLIINMEVPFKDAAFLYLIERLLKDKDVIFNISEYRNSIGLCLKTCLE